MCQHIINLQNGLARNPATRLKSAASFQLDNGEHIAIVGPNGAGKSMLIEMLTGKYPLIKGSIEYDFAPGHSNAPYENIKYITFRDSYGTADANYYHQQRWNSQDQYDIPIVSESLGDIENVQLRDELFELFGMEPLLDKKLIYLSNGEMRKFQLIKTLITNPRVLIIDNPFIGLDARTRELLSVLLKNLSQRSALQIVLVVSRIEDIPEFITHVVYVNDMVCGEKVTRKEFFDTYKTPVTTDIKSAFEAEVKRKMDEIPDHGNSIESDMMVKLNNVSIKYGNRTILKGLDWTVMKGEKWALSGENGAGKSTLLSIICADNPQSYACDISLFGRKRGTGESIWDIKKHIGYVSPEMHRSYTTNNSALEIVASGLLDTIGLYVKPKPEQIAISESWMDIFGISDLKDRPMNQLSSGEQRLILVARAFVKDPELLILDEPLHGLDAKNRAKVKTIIECFCQRRDKTLIMVTHYEEELPKSITKRLFLKRNI